MTLPTFHAHDWWNIAVGAACGLTCALPGALLVLRRLSLLGDAISHSVLPGIAVAFLLTASRDLLPMLLGAAGAGLFTVIAIHIIHRYGRVAQDASMGVVYTCMFAIGIWLISRSARSVDLDASCVLLGQLELAVFDRNEWGVPKSLVRLSSLGLLNILLLVSFFKEIKIASFDGALAASMGFRPGLINAALMICVAATCVASFESVGSILVIAMLIAPAAAARLWTDRFAPMLVISVLIGMVSSPLGYLFAKIFNASAGGMMAVVAAGLFVVSLLLSPRQGLVMRFFRRARLSLRIAQEDVLADLFRREEGRLVPAPGSRAHVPLAWTVLRLRGLVRAEQLTDSGRIAAMKVIRSHRLWETFLSKHLNLPVDHVHDPSEFMEHFIDDDMVQRLRAEVDQAHDAQGRPIP